MVGNGARSTGRVDPGVRATPGVDWWAFRPVRRPAVPRVRNRSWVRSPIDAFFLARLEAKGLGPAPEADRRTL
ncbi:MAG: hypothetical protein NZ557_08185, partial [Chthonomonadaceae bacterium]|nr:hypothetical protein [Chthonomonadaceae bacterium]